MFDELISNWSQENLSHGPVALDAETYEQVWAATLALRKAKDPDIDKWFNENFMNAPPLSCNTMAFNQVKAAVADLKARIAAAKPEEAPPLPLKFQQTPAEPAEPKE